MGSDALDGLEWLSTGQTRTHTGRLFPIAGESFFSDRARPILTLIEDGSPGPHDMLYPPCDPAMYAAVGHLNHPNCKENFEAALAAVGLALPFEFPDPVNLFQNSLPTPDRTLDVLASINPPGGYVVLRAELDLTLVVTACSMDVYPPYLTNGGVCTEILIDVIPSD